MGCDIHLITEIRKNGKWERVLEIPEEIMEMIKEEK